MVAYLLPVVGIALGALVLGDPVTVNRIAGTALIIAGIALVNSGPRSGAGWTGARTRCRRGSLRGAPRSGRLHQPMTASDRPRRRPRSRTPPGVPGPAHRIAPTTLATNAATPAVVTASSVWPDPWSDGGSSSRTVVTDRDPHPRPRRAGEHRRRDDVGRARRQGPPAEHDRQQRARPGDDTPGPEPRQQPRRHDHRSHLDDRGDRDGERDLGGAATEPQHEERQEGHAGEHADVRHPDRDQRSRQARPGSRAPRASPRRAATRRPAAPGRHPAAGRRPTAGRRRDRRTARWQARSPLAHRRPRPRARPSANTPLWNPRTGPYWRAGSGSALTARASASGRTRP